MGHRVTTGELPAHVLIFPLPLQGHVNSMLNLAELLCLSDLHVTMLLSEYNHDRLLRHSSLHTRFSRYPGFRIATISDGLPDDHPRAGPSVVDITLSIKEVGGSNFRHLMESTDGLSDGGGRRRVTSMIIDELLSFAIPVVEEMGIPYVYFRTSSACSFWVSFCLEEIIDAGEYPVKGKDEDKYAYWKNKEMDLMVTSVPGMEGLIRRRDIPRLDDRVDNIHHPVLEAAKTVTKGTVKAAGFILNTFEDLEGPILDKIREHMPNLYSIGPLHAHLKARLELDGMETTHHSSSFWKEDGNWVAWLDSQPTKSVLYVSFGSVTMLTRDELLEFWYGLVNSGQRYLWVVRPDSVVGADKGAEIPTELEEGTKARGHIVGWVPQQEVLIHPAVGAFFTHGGWNSTLECISIGLPMLCWSYIADQTTNSRFISEVWKIGLDIKDTCDRNIVEKAIMNVMVDRREEFLGRAHLMAKSAKKAVLEEGSSYVNLNRLIEFLKSTV